jgi:hypothetical protein
MNTLQVSSYLLPSFILFVVTQLVLESSFDRDWLHNGNVGTAYRRRRKPIHKCVSLSANRGSRLSVCVENPGGVGVV